MSLSQMAVKIVMHRSSVESILWFAWIMFAARSSVCALRPRGEPGWNDGDEQGESTEPQISHREFHLGPQITGWDGQRAEWMQQNPHRTLNRQGKNLTILVTSSQSEPCPSAAGDHYLLKSAKNKMDYAQLHGISVYYSLAILDQQMNGFFVKFPLIRELMVTNPGTEWIWWMDSDALFTDMSFEIPLDKYRDYNLVVHGWDSAIYERKSWFGLNTGVFLIRNCQWSLDLLDIWAAMGEDFAYNRRKMGTLVAQTLTDRPDFPIDDQAALIYLLSTSHAELRPKVFAESSYALHGFWVWAMKEHDSKLKDKPMRVLGASTEYWPFITHFVGCKPCTSSLSGSSYDLDVCLAEMERAFNLADNQLLHLYGFQHQNLSSSDVKRTRRDWGRPLDFLGDTPLQFLRQHPWTGASRSEYAT